MTIQQAIKQLTERQDLTAQQMQAVMRDVMTGACTEAQIAGFLIALRMKGETVMEITTAAQVMRSLAAEVTVSAQAPIIDIVGTGGDGTSTFNISTASSFVAAAAGAVVAKHGNRSVSSQSGSADLLEQAGAYLNLSPQHVTDVIAQAGIGFLFAPIHHSAMKHAIGPRKEMAVRTIFNLLGPLTNPAEVKRQLVGVYAPELTTPLAQVFAELGSEHTMVVHSHDGMDEISACAPTDVAEWREGGIKQYTISPEQFGLPVVDIDDLVVANATESLQMIERVFAGEQIPARQAVALNAGAGIYVAGLVSDLAAGVALAVATLDAGKAQAALQTYVQATQQQATAEVG